MRRSVIWFQRSLSDWDFPELFGPTNKTIESGAKDKVSADANVSFDRCSDTFMGRSNELWPEVDGAVKSRGASFQLYIFQQLISQ